MTFNDPPKSKPGATEQEQVYALYKYLLETSAKLNLLQQELSAGLTASGASGTSGGTVVDAALSDTSSNPVRNSTVTAALAECAKTTDLDDYAKTTDLDDYAKTDDLDAYLPLTGGTLTGSVIVDGSGTALAHNILTDDAYTSKTFLQSAAISDGTYCAQLGYQSGLHGGALQNWLRLYSGKTVLKQDLQDADGVAYIKQDALRKLLYTAGYGATEIAASADLNTLTYLKVGKYFCASNKLAKTLSNCPVTRAFMMEVYNPLDNNIDDEDTSAWSYRLRRLTAYSGAIWQQRVETSGTAGVYTYGDWVQLH